MDIREEHIDIREEHIAAIEGDPRIDRSTWSRNKLAMFSSLGAMALLCVMLMFASGPNSLQAQGVSIVKVDIALVDKGLRANKLIGRSVVNDQGETIGKVDDIVITQDHNLYVPLQVGGFLGIGSRLVVVPYDSLHFDENGRKILLPGASREELKKMAEFKYLG